MYMAICKYLKPEYALMLDVGTRPDAYAIQKLYQYLLHNPIAGGVCGEIEVDLQDNRDMITTEYFLESAQFFEYKLGHTPDKACESFFGFVSVLPGAYAMFRWKAIKGPPLDQFFKNVNTTEPPACSGANEYLAEDRILCLQLYIRPGQGYTV